MTSTPYRFRFKCSYFGLVDYEVTGDGPRPYRLTIRHQANDHEREIYNGTPEEFERDVVAAVGRVYANLGRLEPLKREVAEAFNAWLQTDHAETIAMMRLHPEKYGEITDDDPLAAPPRHYMASHYVIGEGWKDSYPEPATAA